MKIANSVNTGDEKLLKMPSLKMRQFDVAAEKMDKKTTIKLMLNQQEGKFKLGETIFYGYPLQHSGRIEAILTKTNLVYSNSFDFYNYDFMYNKFSEKDFEGLLKRPKEVFVSVKNDIYRDRPINHTFYSFIDLANTETFLFIAETKTFARTI